MARIYVVGIGYKPLDEHASGILCSADIICASERLVDVFKRYDEFDHVKERIKVINTAEETMSSVKSWHRTENSGPRTVVILASGDPLFFGIGRRIIEEFGKDMVEIMPDLSSVQWAFAKIKEPWDHALLISLHGGPDPGKRRKLEYELSDIPYLITSHDRVAILTDKENNPTIIAETIMRSPELQNFGAGSLQMYVCEKLGYPDEKITRGSPEHIASLSFSAPNVVIIMHEHASL